MCSTSFGEARPVRMTARSSRVACTALRILASASLMCSLSSILLPFVLGPVWEHAHLGPHVLAQHHPLQVPVDRQVEHNDRQLVVHAQGDGGGVHHLEAPVEH